MRLSNQKHVKGFITISVLGLVLLTGCGFKGPLYLPPPPDTLSGKPSSPSNQTDQPSSQTSVQSGSTVSPYSPFMQQNPSLVPAPRIIE